MSEDICVSCARTPEKAEIDRKNKPDEIVCMRCDVPSDIDGFSWDYKD